MSETSILLDELRERVRRFVEMAERIGVSPEELAEEALRRFPPPEEDSDAGHLMSERIARLSESTGVDLRVVRGALMVPRARADAFEALERLVASRKRLERKYGQFSSSGPLIREDRDR